MHEWYKPTPCTFVHVQLKHWGREGLEEGDVLVSNHPQLAGGSHLPDITVITPVFNHGACGEGVPLLWSVNSRHLSRLGSC
jgi:5-oxoprolinase (ATP-hydrolysing)